MEETTKLFFNVPSRQSPGYLRRMKRVAVFEEERNKTGLTVALVEKMAAFLADYVANDLSYEQKVELLWECSEEQINELMTAIKGGGSESPLLPPNPEPIVTS